VISRELKREGVLKGEDELVSIVVAERDASDRARRIRVKLSDGRDVEFSGERLRSALGYGALKSTRFEMLEYSVEGEAAGIQFQGRGFGHGVGLCQWGARHLAEKGKSAEEILAHYYPLYSIRASVEAGLAQATATLE
jgi:stage II sporulation protein D